MFVIFCHFFFLLLTQTISIGAELNSILMFVVIFSSGTVIMYVLTYFATIISLKISNISNVVYEEKWYKYPKLFDIYVLMLIQATQKPQYFTGYKIVYCNLETFVGVRNLLLGKVSN